MIRIGRRKYTGGKFEDPTYPGFSQIIVMTASTSYGSLGPYVLKDGKGRIMENIWQASKVYPKVPKSKQYYSRWDKTVIWDHPAEVHVDGNNILPAYMSWRQKLMYASDAVRYPVTYSKSARASCMFAMKERPDGTIDPTPLNYIDSRKQIYLPVYIDLVRKHTHFQHLKDRLAKGENLLIIEVDGPHQESLGYYQETYGVGDDFIEQDTMIGNLENYNIMLNDPKHPFGHGYCLGIALSL